MATVSKGVALSLGVITATVSVHGALDTAVKAGNKLICDTGHDPVLIRQPYVCDECHSEVPAQQLKKGRLVEGGLVVLTDEDLASARENVDKYKKVAPVSAHPADQTQLLASGDKLYFLTPDGGNAAAYALIRDLVERHPELTFLTQWVPRSALGLFQVVVIDGALALSERTSAPAVKEAPPLVDGAPDALLTMAETVLAASITDYSATNYGSDMDERLAKIIAGRTVVPVAGAAKSEPTMATVTDLTAALAAQVARIQKPKAAPKPRTRAKASA